MENRNRKTFKDWEDSYIMGAAEEGTTMEHVATALARTESSIKQRATRLRKKGWNIPTLQGPDAPGQDGHKGLRRWTEDECRFLQQNPASSDSHLAKQLDRTEEGVRKKRRILGAQKATGEQEEFTMPWGADETPMVDRRRIPDGITVHNVTEEPATGEPTRAPVPPKHIRQPYQRATIREPRPTLGQRFMRWMSGW